MAGGFLDLGRLSATIGLNTASFMAGMNQVSAAMRMATQGMMIAGRTMTRFLTLPMVLAGGAAIQLQKDFEFSMTKIIGLVGESRAQVQAWTKDVLNMAKATGRGPVELADALYFITSSGISGAEALQVLEVSAQAAAVGLGETNVVADLVTSAMNAYGHEVLSAAQATDILVATVREGKAEATDIAAAMGQVVPIAAEFGVQFDELGASFASMTRLGTKSHVVATQLKAILSAMASPSMAAADAMAKYGTNAETFRRTIREKGFLQALLDLRTATEGHEEALSEIFPNIRALMGALNLLGKNIEFNIDIFNELANASGSLATALEEVHGTTQQRLNIALATLQVTAIKLGEVLKPLVTNILARVSDVFNRMSSSMENLTEGQRKLKVTTMLLTAAMGPLFLIIAKILQIIAVNKWLALGVAIAAVTLVLIKYIAAMNTAAKSARVAKREHDRIREGLAAESVEINNLFSDLRTLTKGTKEWEAAREKVNSKYGAYLENIITETTLNDELAVALNRVTIAREAEAGVEAFGKEKERAQQAYFAAYKKRMGDYIQIANTNRAKLEKLVGFGGFSDFLLDLQKGIDEGAQLLTAAGGHYDKVYSQIQSKAKAISDTYLLSLKDAGVEIKGFYEFPLKFSNLVKMKAELDGQIKVIDDGIAGWKEAFKNLMGVGMGEEDKEKALALLDKELEALESGKDALSESDLLRAKITKHEEKLKLVEEGLKATEEAILVDLRAQLKAREDLESSVGSIAKLEGDIAKLEGDRKYLSGKALEDNSLALAEKERELELVKLETSGLNAIAKLRGKITLMEKEGEYLSGEAAKRQTNEILDAKETLALMELEASGLSDIEKTRGRIVILVQKGLRLNGALKEQNNNAIFDEEQKLALQELETSGLSEEEKVRKRIEIQQRESTRLSGEQYRLNEESVRKQKQAGEIAELKLLGASREVILQTQLAHLEEDKAYSGEKQNRTIDDAIYKLKRQIQLEDRMVGGYGILEKTLTKIEDVEHAIDNAQTASLGTLGQTLLKAENLRQVYLDMLAPAEDTWAKPGTQMWYDFYNERIRQIKSIADTEMGLSRENTEEMMRLQDMITQQQLNDLGRVLDATQAFMGSIVSLFDARMNAEMEIVENSEMRKEQIEKRKEQIEKEYMEKKKRWAIAMAIINTALAVTKAYSEGGFVVGIITGALMAAAGAVEIAEISAQSFAKGGLVYGDTVARIGEYPGASSNPEVIAPLDKLKAIIGEGMGGTVVFEIEGRKLVGVLEREKTLRNSF